MPIFYCTDDVYDCVIVLSEVFTYFIVISEVLNDNDWLNYMIQ